MTKKRLRNDGSSSPVDETTDEAIADIWEKFLHTQDDYPPFTRSRMPELRSLERLESEIRQLEDKIVDAMKEIRYVRSEISRLESDPSRSNELLVASKGLLVRLIERETIFIKSQQDLIKFRQKFLVHANEALEPVSNKSTLRLLQLAASSGQPPSSRTLLCEEADQLWDSIEWRDGPKFGFRIETQTMLQYADDFFFKAMVKRRRSENTKRSFYDIPKELISTIMRISNEQVLLKQTALEHLLEQMEKQVPKIEIEPTGDTCSLYNFLHCFKSELILELKLSKGKVWDDHYLFPLCRGMHRLYDVKYSSERSSNVPPLSTIATITFTDGDDVSIGWSISRFRDLREDDPRAYHRHGIAHDAGGVITMFNSFVAFLI